MSFKRWLALLLFYVSYLFFGASIYYFIEHTEELQQRASQLADRLRIHELIISNLQGDDETKNRILANITDYCGKKVTLIEDDKLEDPLRWTFYHAFFFAFTVCSTVGYGNLSPSTTLGRMILIGYSLIGMPVNTILFAGLGEYFGRLFRDIYRRYKNYKMSNDDLYIPKQFGLIATITMALIPGIFVFIILPSCIFSYFEDWPFTLSIYYSYVTTTTIGFGDYVPTFQPHQERYFGGWFVVYQIFVIVWFIFSLGYLLMIMGFITKGLRSKRLRNLEHQLKSNIRNTQQRIWYGVVKDVGYLRKLINEVYINVKPIYNETGTRAPCDMYRSMSCPDLSIYKVTTPIVSRKRAFSESYNKFVKDSQTMVGQGTPVNRASSDTNLDKINKEKTFETVNAFRETTSLLAKVVSALSDIQLPPQYDGGQETISNNSIGGVGGGYHGFSDSQILSDEILSNNNIGQNDLLPRHRERASSDFFINPKTIPVNTQNEWTWCGDNHQIQQEINDRARFYKNNNLVKTALYKSRMNNSVILNVEPKPGDINAQQKKKRPSKFSSEFVMDLFRRRSSTIDAINKNQLKRSSNDITNSGNNLSQIPDKNHIIRNNYSTVTSNNSSLKSDKKSGLLSFNNTSSIEELPSQNYNQQRKSSLYPFYSNNLINQPKDPLNLRKSIQHRNSIFYKPNRSGSLAFPIATTNRIRTSSFHTDYRKSIDSFNSDKKGEDILENTSIADLIRALEVLHTRAVTQTDQFEPIQESNDEKVKKKRKFGTFIPPQLSPLFTIFGNSNNNNINNMNNSSNSNNNNNNSNNNNINNISNQDTNQDQFDENRPIASAIKNIAINSRRSSLFTESGQFNKRDQQPSDINKYGRRFSVRPAELQTPPGKSQYYTGQSSITSYPTALQRKLSLRHSKDFKRNDSSKYGTSDTITNSSNNSNNNSNKNINSGGESDNSSNAAAVVSNISGSSSNANVSGQISSNSSNRSSIKKQFLPGPSSRTAQTNLNRNFNSNENSDC